MLRGNRKWFLLGIPVALLVLAVVGPYVYIHFIQSDPPPKLTLETSPTASSSSGSDASSSAAAPTASVDGTWTATSDSIVGYRVKEVLLGQDTDAVGRTNSVTGTFTLSAQRDGANVKVNGEIPITFSDYGISNPSNQTATVGDSGTLEFLLVFSPATS